MSCLTRRLSLLPLLILVLAAAATAQERHPLTFDDLIGFGRVSDPQPSPDGRWVVYVVDRHDKATNARTSDLWLVPLAGGNSRRLTASGKRDTRPRWLALSTVEGSPDGPEGSGRIAFLSNRDGSWQIWTIGLDGGEAAKLASLPVDVGGLLYSPEGPEGSGWLAFTAEVYPDCPADPSTPFGTRDALACTAKRDEEMEKSKVKARLYDKLLFRHWNSWFEGKRTHIFVIAADGSGKPRDLTPGDFDAPPFSLGGPDGYAFSPDGRELCFERNTDSDPALSTNNDLWVVPIAGGPSTSLGTSPSIPTESGLGASEPRKITSNPAWDGSPLYSPDGRWIAYRAQVRPGFEADRFRLMLYERATGKTIPLTESFDHWVEEFVWAPDSRTIYFTAPVRAQSPIFAVSVPFVPQLRDQGKPDGQVKELVGASYNTNLALTADGRSFVFTRQSLSEPAEVWLAPTQRLAVESGRAAVTGSKAEPLTRTNQALVSRIEWGAVEELYYDGPAIGGAEVHAWLIKPPGFDPQRKYPAVILIHGGPQSVWANSFHYRWNAHLFAAPGYVVALLNPRGSVGWGQRFVDEISRDWGGKVYQDVLRGVAAVTRLPYVDPTRLCAAGGSYGGYMANWLAGQSSRFRCLISHAGVFNLTSMYGSTEELWFPEWDLDGTPWTNPKGYARWSPHTYVPKFRTPTLVIHGELDYRVPLAEGLQMFTSLQRRKVPSKLLYFPDEGHWILKPQNAELWYKTVHAWLAQYLK